MSAVLATSSSIRFLPAAAKPAHKVSGFPTLEIRETCSYFGLQDISVVCAS